MYFNHVKSKLLFIFHIKNLGQNFLYLTRITHIFNLIKFQMYTSNFAYKIEYTK
jgi:hypothetical protein